jgi:hypothetical protein
MIFAAKNKFCSKKQTCPNRQVGGGFPPKSEIQVMIIYNGNKVLYGK